MYTTWIQNVYKFYYIKAIENIYNSYSFSILYLCVTLPHNVTLSIKKDMEKESEKLYTNSLVYKNLIKVLCSLYSFLGFFGVSKKTCPDTLLILANKKDRAFCPILFLHHSQIILTTKTIYVNFYSKSSLI